MSVIKLVVDDREVDVDLDHDRWTLQQHQRLQTQVGNMRYRAWFTTGAIELIPDFLEAYIYAALLPVAPDVKPSDIDLDFIPLMEALGELANKEPDEGKASDSS